MAETREGKKARQRQRERGRERTRAIRNGLIGAAVAGGIIAVIVLGVIVGSRGGGSGSGGSSAGGLAPDFTIRTTSWSGGREFVLSRQRGKPVAIYSVAGWCSSCIPETEAWGNISREMGDKISVLIISADPGETENSLQRFKELAIGPERYWAIDKSQTLVKALNIFSLDTTIIVDPDGRIAYRHGVPTSEEELRDQLAEIESRSPAAVAP